MPEPTDPLELLDFHTQQIENLVVQNVQMNNRLEAMYARILVLEGADPPPLPGANP